MKLRHVSDELQHYQDDASHVQEGEAFGLGGGRTGVAPDTGYIACHDRYRRRYSYNGHGNWTLAKASVSYLLAPCIPMYAPSLLALGEGPPVCRSVLRYVYSQTGGVIRYVNIAAIA